MRKVLQNFRKGTWFIEQKRERDIDRQRDRESGEDKNE